MRKYNKTIGALAAVSALTAGVAQAEIEGDVYAGYSSSYVFRGVNNGDDLIDAGVNLSTDMLGNGITATAGLWYGSLNDDVRLVDNQLNSSIGLSKDFGGVTLGAGYINYDFQGAGPVDTQEVYLSLGKEIAGINLGATAFYDIDENDGWYFEATAGKSFALSECVSLDLGVGAGFYDSYAGVIGSGFHHWFASVSLPWSVRETVTITPFVKYTDVESGEFSGLDGNTLSLGNDEVIGGVSVSVKF